MQSSVKHISPQQLQAMRERGQAVELIDVRTPAEYRAGHAAGAKLLPLDQLNQATLPTQLQQSAAGPEQPLYLTCQSGLRAQQAAERLMGAGYSNLVLVEGGTQAWKQAGLPMQRCGQVISLERQVQITLGSLLVLKVFFGFTVHELFFVAAALIGAGLIVAGITHWCGMARLLARLPWNRQGDCTELVPSTALNPS
jgi:rhodanese-related sulfurtransferase